MFAPLGGALKLSVAFTFKRPKSNKEQYHCHRIDLDNLLKALCDGLNGIVWCDDSQIVGIAAEKRWDDEDGVILEVTRLE